MAKDKYKISVGGTTYALDARPDRLDLRDRAYQPPTLSLPSQWPLEKDVERLFPAYSNAGLILDQGQEGACTGFGLAAVVNYLQWTRSYGEGGKGAFKSVSPYMLYDLARFYDEWPGQDYDGSSCRGAMKGWHKHGVCEQSLWAQTIYPVSVMDSTSRGASRALRKHSKKAGLGFQDYIPDQRWPQDAVCDTQPSFGSWLESHVSPTQGGLQGVVPGHPPAVEQARWGRLLATCRDNDTGFTGSSDEERPR